MESNALEDKHYYIMVGSGVVLACLFIILAMTSETESNHSIGGIIGMVIIAIIEGFIGGGLIGFLGDLLTEIKKPLEAMKVGAICWGLPCLFISIGNLVNHGGWLPVIKLMAIGPVAGAVAGVIGFLIEPYVFKK